MTDTNASSSDLAAVMRRVAKLLAMANDGRGNAEEAASAAAMAEKIMRKYQLDNSDIIEAEMRKDRSAMVMRPVFANMKRDDPKRTVAVKNPSWGQFLAVAIARLHECEVRQGFDQNKFGQTAASLRFFGYHADVEMCVFTFDYLVGVMISAVQYRQKNVTKDRLATEAYRKGFVSELTRRLALLQSDKEREQQEAVASRALVISKRQHIVEAFGDFGYREVTKTAGIKNYDAYRAGTTDASKVDIARRGIGSDAAAAKAIK